MINNYTYFQYRDLEFEFSKLFKIMKKKIVVKKHLLHIEFSTFFSLLKTPSMSSSKQDLKTICPSTSSSEQDLKTIKN